MSFITINNIWQEYGDHVVLERLNLQVKEGEFCSMVGASGCGKSTFLRLLLGQEAPSRGSITLDDKPLTAEPDSSRGVVFQRYSVFPHLTVLDNVTIGIELPQSPLFGRLFGAKKRAAREQAAQMLEKVGLGHALQNTRRSSPVGCSSVWPSPVHSLCNRAFYCWMSRLARLTPASVKICMRCCYSSGAKPA